MTSKILLEQYMAERHALGFSLKTDEGCIRRFLRDFAEPDDGVISFTKEYVLNHIGNRLNAQTNTILRDVSAINGFLDFVIRKGYTASSIRKVNSLRKAGSKSVDNSKSPAHTRAGGTTNYAKVAPFDSFGDVTWISFLQDLHSTRPDFPNETSCRLSSALQFVHLKTKGYSFLLALVFMDYLLYKNIQVLFLCTTTHPPIISSTESFASPLS